MSLADYFLCNRQALDALFCRRRCGVYFSQFQRSHIPPSEHSFKVTCSHPALNLRGLGGSLINFDSFIMRLTFILCLLVGFAGDSAIRGVLHRSLFSAGNNITVLCEWFLAPNASKHVGKYGINILTAGFWVWRNILSVIYRFVLNSFVGRAV